jgi:hypothetical protein
MGKTTAADRGGRSRKKPHRMEPLFHTSKLPEVPLYDLRHCCATMLPTSSEHPRFQQGDHGVIVVPVP